MSHPLKQRVEEVQTAAARLIWLYGVARFALMALLAIAALALIDSLLRPHDPVIRWTLSIAAIALLGVSFWQLALPALIRRLSLVATAQHIERRFPELGERLSSATAFLAQAEGDPTAGSAHLRRAVVAEAEALSAELDFRAALDSSATRRAGWVLAIALVVTFCLAALNASIAALAMARLAQPWRELAWPRRHELAFLESPRFLATAGDFEVTLIDRRGALPADTRIFIRQQTATGWHTEVKDVKPLGERAIFRLDNVTRNFDYRARGGDDDAMPWQTLEVIDLPKIVELQVLVQPPRYTGLAQQSEGYLVRALVGSELQIHGKLDQPIRSAALQSASPELPPPQVELAADKRRFHAPSGTSRWIVERSGTYALALTDERGINFGRDTRIELRAIPDNPPSIVWETPAEQSFCTSGAVIPIKVAVKDDVAIHKVELRYLRPGQSDEEQVVELYGGPAAVAPADRPALTAASGEQRQLSFNWDLSRLTGLSPGDALSIRITADDYKPQLATTAVRRLTIISAEELEYRTATRQAAILSQLGDALQLARQSREQTRTLDLRLTTNGQLAAGDLNLLQAAQFKHDQIERLLGTSSDGVEGQIAALLEELKANQAGDQASGQHLTELLGQVRALNRGLVPAIHQELTEAFKSASDSSSLSESRAEPSLCGDGPDEIRSRLQRTAEHQDGVITAIETMVGALTQWDHFSRISREISQIRDDQQRLNGETDELRLKTAASALEVLPVDRALSRQLAQRQLELGRRFDKHQTRMDEMLKRLTAADPPAAAALADASAAARRLAVGEQMRQAAARLTQLQLGQARDIEQRVVDALKELIELLSMRRDDELAHRLTALREASAELRSMVQRGAKNSSELAAVAGQAGGDRARNVERLRRELNDLAQKSRQLSRQLARLQAPRPAASLARAATMSSAATAAAGADNLADAQRQADESRGQLEEANVELSQAIAAVEEELAREQLARTEQAIASLVSRQQNVLRETKRLDGLRQAETPLDASQKNALDHLASEQRLVGDETAQLGLRFSAAAAFGFALETAAADMRRAGALLTRGETSVGTQDLEQAALTRLEQILIALRPDEAAPGRESAPEGQRPMPPQNAGDLAASSAELKLLKLLQEAINRRTAELEMDRAKRGTLSAQQQRELDDLAREQGRLADMVLGLIEVKSERPEDNPDPIPDREPRRIQKPGDGAP